MYLAKINFYFNLFGFLSGNGGDLGGGGEIGEIICDNGGSCTCPEPTTQSQKLTSPMFFVASPPTYRH